MKRTFHLFILPLLFTLTSCMESQNAFVWKGQPGALDINVRVLIAEGQKFSLNPSETYIFEAGQTTAMTDSRLEISYNPKGIVVNGTLFKTNKITAKGLKSFQLGKDAYRGTFHVLRQNRKLLVINTVNIEDYLYSVVPKEIYASWNQETLKAQAIASRTYALHEVKRRNRDKKDFDLYSDTRSQVYLGMKTENPKVNKLVDDTAGLVLTYEGEIIKSYFHASSGGRLSGGIEIFDKAPYLQQSSSYVAENDPSSLWEHKIHIKDIERIYPVEGGIKSIQVASRHPSGRIDKIHLYSHNGQLKEIDAYKLRQELGSTYMKSTLAKIGTIDHQGFVVISGRGYGHGVGMGQWDAEELAKKGLRYNNILAFFYKGSTLKNLY